MDLDLTQDSVDTEFIKESNSDSEEGIQFLDLGECEIIDELDLQELEQIPHTIVTLTEGQVLEEFMLEKEIGFQDIHRCEEVELLDEQGIEESIDREKCATKSIEIPVRTACEQEECIEEEICNRSPPDLPKLYRAEESVHTDEIKLETLKMNVMEISELPRGVKLEMPVEQNGSKLGQDVNMDSDVPTQFHVVPSRKILGNISKLHTKWKRVLGSKIVRRAKTTRLVKREIPSICRPPPELPDRQNGLNVKSVKEDYPKCTMPMKIELIIGPLQHPLLL